MAKRSATHRKKKPKNDEKDTKVKKDKKTSTTSAQDLPMSIEETQQTPSGNVDSGPDQDDESTIECGSREASPPVAPETATFRLTKPYAREPAAEGLSEVPDVKSAREVFRAAKREAQKLEGELKDAREKLARKPTSRTYKQEVMELEAEVEAAKKEALDLYNSIPQ